MNNEVVMDICRDVLEESNLSSIDWDLVSVVVDISEGHFAQSGFLYRASDYEPCTVKTNNRKQFSNNCRKLQESIARDSGRLVKQMLIQVEKESGRIKIDFEFDDPTRWSIGPGNLKEIRESLRPKFD